MFTKYLLLAALALHCVGLRAELLFHPTDPAGGQSAAKKYSNPSDIAYPMFFGNGAEEVRVRLSGDITHADVADLKVMAGLLKSGKQKLAGNSVWLASTGGDLEASMRLGRQLREMGVYTVVAATRDIRDLKGVIPKPAKPVSVEDMNKAVRRHAVR